MRKHRAAAYEIEDELCSDEELLRPRGVWDEAVEIGERNGYRNAQATVLAPTGTISFLMDCDTTGIEPDFAVKFKELVGGGQMTIVNRTVPLALQTLGYSTRRSRRSRRTWPPTRRSSARPASRRAPAGVRRAAGERAISPMGHIKMMARRSRSSRARSRRR